MLPFLEKLLKSRNEKLKEKRKSTRYRTTETFAMECKRKHSQQIRYGQGRNISLGGARFATTCRLRKGEKIDLALLFSKDYKPGSQIQLKAKVTNFSRPRGASRYRVGCQFLKQSPKDKKDLEQFLAWVKEHRNTRVLEVAA